MKKLLTVLLSSMLAVFALFSFAGCGDTEGEQKIKLVNVDLSSEEYAFAVNKNNDALLTQVNRFFVDKADEVAAIFDKYTAEDADLTSFGSSNIKTTPANPKSSDELVVATNLEFSPFEYKNGNKIAGIDMEIAQLLADYLNKTLVVVHMDFDSVVTSVQTIDTYDIGIAGLTITPARQEQVNFSTPYFGATQSIVVKADDATFDNCSTAEEVENVLKGLTGDKAKCGGQKGTTSHYYINGNADFNFTGFNNLSFAPHESAALAITDMLNGNLSFVVVDKTTAQALVNSFNN